MTDEQYKKLSFYLKKIISDLEQHGHSFLTMNIELITILRKKCDNILSSFDSGAEIDSEPLSFNEIIALSREVLASIDSEWVNEFDKLITNNVINFNHSHSCIDFRNGIYGINICLNYNYNDIIIIVHEFAHYMHLKGKEKISQCDYIVSEFIGIYFELYTTQYIQSLGNKVDYLHRIRRLDGTIRNLKEYDVLFLMLKKHGEINTNTFTLLDSVFHDLNISDTNKYDEILFESRCIDMLNYFEAFDDSKVSNEMLNKSSNAPIAWKFIEDYKYLFGSYLAYYAYENCDAKDVVNFCSCMNSIDDIDAQQLWGALRKINIDVENDSLYDDASIIMQEFIEKYGKGNKAMI